MKNKVLLIVLDGYGHGKDYKGNAITRANTPFLNKIKKDYPWTLLRASGESVGIPKGTQGGSEVGHLTMGAGRVVNQPLLTIDKSIKDKSFYKNPELIKAAKHVKAKNSALHIIGMISDQGVHADIAHCLALLDFAKQQKIKKVYVHGITDGRDVHPQSADKFIRILQKHIKQTGLGEIATLIGRFYAMDRDKNLDRTKIALDLYKSSKGRLESDPIKAIKKQYAEGEESDYYIKPIVLNENAKIHKDDAVIFFNFRTDRAQQLTEQIIKTINPFFVAFGAYTKKAPVAFPPQSVKNNLGAVLEKHHKTQLRAAETEKYAHVTFFFNSQIKEPFKHEKRILVDSLKCESYAEQPQMSALKIAKAVSPELKKDIDFIAVNFANLDLVGHSGNLKATIVAVETIDKALNMLIPIALENGYSILVTGDHGNAEHMLYPNGDDCPSHTKNPVPIHLISNNNLKFQKTSHSSPVGGLMDIAPTILSLMSIKIPKEMTGSILTK